MGIACFHHDCRRTQGTRPRAISDRCGVVGRSDSARRSAQITSRPLRGRGVGSPETQVSAAWARSPVKHCARPPPLFSPGMISIGRNPSPANGRHADFLMPTSRRAASARVSPGLPPDRRAGCRDCPWRARARPSNTPKSPRSTQCWRQEGGPADNRAVASCHSTSKSRRGSPQHRPSAALSQSPIWPGQGRIAAIGRPRTRESPVLDGRRGFHPESRLREVFF